MDADTVGRISLRLGAGRSRADDAIDFSVGIDQLAKIGDVIETGDVVARVHAQSEEDAETAENSLWEGSVCESCS